MRKIDPTVPATFRLFTVWKNDYFLFLYTAAPLVLFGLLLYFSLTGHFPTIGDRPTPGSNDVSFFALSAAVILIIVVPLIMRRITLLKRIIMTGTPLIGQVDTVAFFRDRGRIEYHFTHKGEQFNSANAIMKTKTAQSIKPNTAIDILVDPKNPRQSLIRIIYC